MLESKALALGVFWSPSLTRAQEPAYELPKAKALDSKRMNSLKLKLWTPIDFKHVSEPLIRIYNHKGFCPYMA